MNNILDYLHPYQNDVKRHEILENIVSLKELDKIINKLIKKFNRSEFVKNLKNRELAKEVSDKSKEF